MQIYHNYRGLERGGCSTVIIGKKASATGRILFGHNEDDSFTVVQTHLVPHLHHEKGEMVTFEDGTAVVPQVPETAGYFWSEVRAEGGISFADGFCNEYGVALVSNACGPSKEGADAKDAALAYALRVLVAERAKSAREAVKIAAELVEKYGYSGARCYQVADKNEAWSIQIPKGFRLAAQRILDDEVYYMPNHFTIHEMDLSDKDHYYASPDLISYAEKQGWYDPAQGPFDFARAYQKDYDSVIESNFERAYGAWLLLDQLEVREDDCRIFAIKAQHSYDLDDVKDVLRSHLEGTRYDETKGGTRSPHGLDPHIHPICKAGTIESTIYEFPEDILLTRMLRAAPKPCCSPYVPWYPVALTRIPAGYEAIPAAAARRSHFAVDPCERSFRPEEAWTIFRTLVAFSDFNWQATYPSIRASVRDLERQWEAQRTALEAGYQNARENGTEKEYLTAYTCQQAEKAVTWAKDMITELVHARAHGPMANDTL